MAVRILASVAVGTVVLASWTVGMLVLIGAALNVAA